MASQIGCYILGCEAQKWKHEGQGIAHAHGRTIQLDSPRPFRNSSVRHGLNYLEDVRYIEGLEEIWELVTYNGVY